MTLIDSDTLNQSCTGQQKANKPNPSGTQATSNQALISKRTQDYALAIGMVLLSVGIAFLVQRLMPHASLALLFLTGVLLVSSRTGLGPSLLASLLSFLAFNFFFTQPLLTFRVDDDRDVTTLMFFLLIATITGNLATRMYREMAQHKASLHRISKLYEFSRQMSSAGTTESVLNALAEHLAQNLATTVHVLLEPVARMQNSSHSEGGSTVAYPDLQATAGPGAELPEQQEIWSGWQANTSTSAIRDWTLFQLSSDLVGIYLVLVHGPGLSDEQCLMVQNLCSQAAIALDRTRLVADLEKERIVAESEQLRSALLSSVSHDLRTPLASIIGSTSSLLEYRQTLSPENRRELLITIDEEARRLDSHVQNLLDMTRLGHGGMKLKRDWVDLQDIVASACHRLRDRLGTDRLIIEIPAELPLMYLHGALIEQAIFNLLDNAIRFSPEHGQIRVTAYREGHQVIMGICDQGPGIDPSDREKIFDMFYTAQQGDRSQRQGTGLGLAICRGMIGAHAGTVSAEDGPNGVGTCMRIMLPIHPSESS